MMWFLYVSCNRHTLFGFVWQSQTTICRCFLISWGGRSNCLTQAPSRRKTSKRDKAKKVKKASFKRSKKHGRGKRDDVSPRVEDAHSVVCPSSPPNFDVPESTSYGDYDLRMIPAEAWPLVDRPNRGKHSYTLSDGTGAVVEVLLGKQGFFVKKVRDGSPGPIGQITWSKFGGSSRAWEEAKYRSGYGTRV